MIAFLEFFPEFSGFNQIPPKVFDCVSDVHIYAQNHSNLDLRALSVFFWGTLQQRKVTNVIIYHQKNSFYFYRCNLC